MAKSKPSLTVSEAIRAAVQASELSMRQIAEQSGVDHAVISRFMSGDRDLRLASADKLVTALGISILRLEEKPTGSH